MASQNKVLIIEDEMALARVLSLKLTGSGFACEVAMDGQEGIDKIKGEEFDLVLMDLILPKKDGFDVLSELKAYKKTPPIVVLSNLSQQSDKDRAKTMGAADFFVKSEVQLSDIITYVTKKLSK